MTMRTIRRAGWIFLVAVGLMILARLLRVLEGASP